MTARDELAIQTLLDGAQVPFADHLHERVAALIADRDRLAAQLAERSKRTDRDALLASLDQRLEDVLLLLSDACLDLADREQEVGRGEVADWLRAEAQGWGWLGHARKWPTEVRNRSWIWGRPDEGETDLFNEQLPISAELLPSSRTFPSSRAALEWVVKLIASREWDPTAAREGQEL